MTILIIGATGTLGRQIVKQISGSGYSVTCLVRNLAKAKFLKSWGAKLIYGDLSLPETIPNALNGIKVIIDASTLRSDDEFSNLSEVDLIGKIALIKASQIAKIDKFIFFSIMENEKFQSIFLMRLKKKIEYILTNSQLKYTIFQISAFYQGLINQYALPILEQQAITITEDDNFLTSFIDTRDVAKICTKILLFNSSVEKTKNKKFHLEGPKVWNSNDIIKLCENLSGQIVEKIYISPFLLNFIKKFISFFNWGWAINDRLAFDEILRKSEKKQVANKGKNQKLVNLYLAINKKSMFSLENYLQDYFENILNRLLDLNYEKNKILKRKDIIF